MFFWGGVAVRKFCSCWTKSTQKSLEHLKLAKMKLSRWSESTLDNSAFTRRQAGFIATPEAHGLPRHCCEMAEEGGRTSKRARTAVQATAERDGADPRSGSDGAFQGAEELSNPRRARATEGGVN